MSDAGSPSRTRKARSTSLRAGEDAAAPWVSPTEGLPLPERVAVLRDVLVSSIEREVEERNVRVILWLADKLKVLDPGLTPERQSADELRRFFNDLDASELREFAGLASNRG